MFPALLGGEESEAQRGTVTCLRSQSKELAALRFEPKDSLLCPLAQWRGHWAVLSARAIPQAFRCTAAMGFLIQP